MVAGKFSCSFFMLFIFVWFWWQYPVSICERHCVPDLLFDSVSFYPRSNCKYQYFLRLFLVLWFAFLLRVFSRVFIVVFCAPCIFVFRSLHSRLQLRLFAVFMLLADFHSVTACSILSQDFSCSRIPNRHVHKKSSDVIGQQRYNYSLQWNFFCDSALINFLKCFC